MSEIDDGGNAFPYPRGAYDCCNSACEPGMSLRQWYAGLAMQAIYSNYYIESEYDMLVTRSYLIADAMIAKSKRGDV